MDKLLQNKNFQKKLAQIAEQQNMPIDEVSAVASTYLEELYTVQHPLISTFGVQFAQSILSRGYDKNIDVNPGEMKDLAKIMRRHPVAFVMTHKTYIDMFVLGVALARHGLAVPHIFSGINMAFLGVAELGRKAGTIFIRRSFKDDEIYKATLRHFISHLVDKQEHFMWAIEGTRSRTGKLVWPKMGILKYILEADEMSSLDVKYIPVSIVYDLIPDVEDMIKETRGQNKSQESLMWFANYIRKMGNDFGRMSLRFGKPLAFDNEFIAVNPIDDSPAADNKQISSIAFELVHNINKATPVTTTSLICTSLLTKFALKKRGLENVVTALMDLMESHKPDALVDRGKALGQSVQDALNLLTRAKIIQQIGTGLDAKYSIVPEQYLTATYYSNMAVHHLYHQAFIELAILKIADVKPRQRVKAFWEEIMLLRDLFKFEFFYSNKSEFSEEIENDLKFLEPDWESQFSNPKYDLKKLLQGQRILISPVVLNTYVEAYKVVGHSLLSLEEDRSYNDRQLLRTCLFLGEEMHWKGQIHRVDSVSKPFIQNGIRLAQNKGLIPTKEDRKITVIQNWIDQLKNVETRLKFLQELKLSGLKEIKKVAPRSHEVIPGSKTADIAKQIKEGEEGPHIGAFFDLDRTLISGFSAKQFVQKRLLSGKATSKEIIAQFSAGMVYLVSNKNFAGMAAISAKGVQGIKEKVFIEVGEDVYLNEIANSIYPESRALVEMHMKKGHTVAIISAATPYQVNPVARDLGIDHVMCTRMEVKDGVFTGNVVEPACWGEGKAHAARELSEKLGLDLDKSHFYTDSAEDMPLMEIVGHPVPVNPDAELSTIAFEREWPIYRFHDGGRPGFSNLMRTGLALWSMVPAALTGMASGSLHLNWTDGVNSMMAFFGDIGTKLAGIQLAVKDPEYMWTARPAVFLFNHQSAVDVLIMAKLLRKDAVAVAKKELQYTPFGPIFKAAGMVFIDRKNKDKAIKALQPAVDALKSGTSLAIAPEGTRSKDYKLGSFKKGAFHMAMQAKVPIVPVIIKNAHDALPKGASIIRPSVVEVVIGKPIPTKRWKKENLDKHISKIRNLYLKELGQKEKTKKRKAKKK